MYHDVFYIGSNQFGFIEYNITHLILPIHHYNTIGPAVKANRFFLPTVYTIRIYYNKLQ